MSSGAEDKILYEFVEYPIPDQRLSAEDIRFLLRTNVVSPFSLVKRLTEKDPYPLMSHPDFSVDFLTVRQAVVKSDTALRFTNAYQRLFDEPEEKTQVVQDSVSAQISDRRKPLLTVIFTTPRGTITGGLITRTVTELKIVMGTMSFKVGQPVQLLIFSKGKKERLHGRVKTLQERADRRNQGQLFYLYEMEIL